MNIGYESNLKIIALRYSQYYFNVIVEDFNKGLRS